MPDGPHGSGEVPPDPSPSLILASGSPQRRAILKQLGVGFEVIVSDVAELSDGPPEEVVAENAFRKASAVAAGLGLGSDDPSAPGLDRGDPSARGLGHHDPGGVHAHGGSSRHTATVLGVDTLVALGRHIYGKPSDAEDARATLELLSGREHRVLSGVCVIEGGRVRSAVAATTVRFRELDGGWLDWYVGTGEWRARAGGYAIQGRGAALVTEIHGDYLNVVGLPVGALLGLLPDLLRASAR